MKRKVQVFAAAAAMATALAACSSSGSGGGGGGETSGSGGSTSGSSSGGTYRVVVLGGIGAEGALADNASTSIQSAQAGADQVNSEGGINGEHVTVDVIDDKADPTTAVTKLREYISAHKPDLVLDSGPSTVATAILPILNAAKILSFNIAPTPDSLNPSKYPYNFDLSASPADYINGFKTYLASKGYKKIAILHGNDAYGTTFSQNAATLLAKDGFQIVSNEPYDVTALDMTPQVQSVQSSHPDAVILDAYGAPLGYILKNIQKLGWNIPLIGDTSVAATGTISSKPPKGLLGTDAVKNLVMEVFKSTKYNPNSTPVVTAVKQMKAHGPIKSTLILAYNYDAFALVKAATDSVKATDTESVAKALIDPTVLKSAKTAILSQYNFNSRVHAPGVGGDEFAFIPPGPIIDGQYH